MGKLQIYSASAGSGKTFQLAKAYIHLLFTNPSVYRNTLAVTFTNKAAGEMKDRILKALYKMAVTEDEKDFSPGIMKDFNLSKEEVRNKAAELLSAILHHYSRFSIQTIDSFFQSVLRNFIRELGLPYNYSLEMNQERILHEVVDLFLQSAGDNRELKRWLVQFAGEKINAGETWNFKKDILKLGNEFFNERGKAFFNQVQDKIKNRDFLEEYRKELKAIAETFENTMAEFGEQGMALMKKYGLEVEDFSHKSSGTGSYFIKLATKSKFEPNTFILAAAEKSEAWFPKASSHQTGSREIIEKEFMPLLSRTIQFYNREIILYNTAIHILKQYYNLGIAFELSEELLTYTREHNAFLMADMGPFLSRITGNNDAPFIYEKTGIYFHHFMLDEFQDTSVVQWSNFKPLINNSLAGGNTNLIVGDVKQSIYRWRNSNWKIMASQIDHDFSGFDLQRETLPNNYRSREQVVAFNNVLFSTAPQLLQNRYNENFEPGLFDERKAGEMQKKILSIYNNPVQDVARPSYAEGGVIRISFPGDKTTWKDTAGIEFTREIGNLLRAGVPAGSIAVLVRTSTDGNRAIQALLDFKEREPDIPDFAVLSSDSLFLQNAPSVRFLVAFLIYLDDPNDNLNLTKLYFEYCFFNEKPLNLGGRNNHFFHFFEDEVFPDKIRNELTCLRKRSLSEIVEEAIRIFQLGKKKEALPYILGFQDIILDFSRKQSGDIRSFLEWWEEEGIKESLPAGNDSGALRVITIHKAKGLQFEYVFIPYADWPLDHLQHAPILWCSLNTAPFNRLSPLPVKYSKDLRNSLFSSYYLEEQLDTYIDNLNLLYVAFTRAVSGLFVFAPPGNDQKNVSGLLFSSLNPISQTNASTSLSGIWKEKDKLWISGSPPPFETTLEKQELQQLTLEEYYGWPYASRMRLKYQGTDFFSEEKREKINQGTLLHEIFENILTADDLDEALLRIHEQGKIDQLEMTHLRNHINQLIANPQVAGWFSGNWEVKAEAEFLVPGGGILRPDRVMIKNRKVSVVDYKFGKVKNETHQRQVKRYKKYLLEMGYPEVSAWLWYVEQGVVEEVT